MHTNNRCLCICLSYTSCVNRVFMDYTFSLLACCHTGRINCKQAKTCLLQYTMNRIVFVSTCTQKTCMHNTFNSAVLHVALMMHQSVHQWHNLINILPWCTERSHASVTLVNSWACCVQVHTHTDLYQMSCI